MQKIFPIPAVVLAILYGAVAIDAKSHRCGAPADALDRGVCTLLGSIHEDQKLPGLSAALILPDGELRAYALGLADAEIGRPMTPATRMFAGSIGKTFVAALALSLAREGVVELDAPISRWVGGESWFTGIAHADGLTLRLLLTHRGGVASHFNPRFGPEVLPRLKSADDRFNAADLLATISQEPAQFEPGERFAYTDTAFVIAALTLEHAASVPYFEQVQQRFLHPLGLGSTGPQSGKVLPGLAQGYFPLAAIEGAPAWVHDLYGALFFLDRDSGIGRNQERGVLRIDPILEHGGGGFVSTPSDLARWAAAFYGGSSNAGAPLAELEREATAQEPRDARVRTSAYGLGTAFFESGFGKAYGHTGRMAGHLSGMFAFPELSISVAVQANHEGLLPALPGLLLDLTQTAVRTTAEAFVIRGASLVDGTGRPAEPGDLLIHHGEMTLLEPSAEPAVPAFEIDAAGLVVAPGFVDVHNHTGQAIVDPARRFNEAFLRQGVTTIVEGPDGSLGPRQIRDAIEVFERQGAGTNVAVYVGHNAVRGEVMGMDQRPPTAAELERMKALVREGMELGAVGLSTGLMYPPGMFSTTGEVVELAREVAPFGGIYDSHVRDPVWRWIASNREAIEIGERSGLAVKLGHLKEVGLHNAGKSEELVALVEESRRRGMVVVSDQYPYDGAGDRLSLEGVLVVAADPRENERLKNDPEFDLAARLRDPASREAVRETSENGVDGGFAWLKAVGYSGLRITRSEDHPELVGRFLSELAEERGLAPFDLVSELILDSEEPIEVKGGVREEALREILVQPWNMIASDGAYLEESMPGRGHPRSTGTFPRVLGRYVRELGLLSLEEAIRKMTSFPAEFVGLPSRGRLADGLPADVVVFDPATIVDRSTYEKPNLFSEGVVHVFVAGVPVIFDGELTTEAPGRFLPRESD